MERIAEGVKDFKDIVAVFLVMGFIGFFSIIVFAMAIKVAMWIIF